MNDIAVLYCLLACCVFVFIGRLVECAMEVRCVCVLVGDGMGLSTVLRSVGSLVIPVEEV